MKALRIILIVLLVLFGAYAIWMATLPSEYRVNRSIVVEAPTEMVFEEVADFRNWEKWSPWLAMDSTMEFTYEGPTSGVDASYSWTAESGNGEQKFTAVVPFDTLRTHIAFEGMGESNGLWVFTEQGPKQTEVSWGFGGKLPFFMRIFGLAMEDQVGPQFESGLNSLKQVAEEKAAAMAEQGMQVEETTFPEIEYYSVRDEVAMEEMTSDFFASRYAEIQAFFGNAPVEMTGMPMALYHDWNEEEGTAVIEVALPIQSDKAGNDRVKKGKTEAGRALKATFAGPYENTGAAHQAIYAYAGENGLQMNGAPLEIYVTDPGNEPDTSKWITEVIYPVK